jgi:hypothetical protein
MVQGVWAQPEEGKRRFAAANRKCLVYLQPGNRHGPSWKGGNRFEPDNSSFYLQI